MENKLILTVRNLTTKEIRSYWVTQREANVLVSIYSDMHNGDSGDLSAGPHAGHDYNLTVSEPGIKAVK